MIPGLKDFVDTGNVKAIEEFLQVEIDDYKTLIETAYDLLVAVDSCDREWLEVADDWLVVAKEVLGK